MYGDTEVRRFTHSTSADVRFNDRVGDRREWGVSNITGQPVDEIVTGCVLARTGNLAEQEGHSAGNEME